jgi:hypothetical protein
MEFILFLFFGYVDEDTMQGRIFINIENELENVTDGILEWSDFAIKARESLDMHDMLILELKGINNV